MHILAPEPISKAYFINPSHHFMCLYLYPSIVARQRLGKNETPTTTTDETIEEFLDESFSMRSVSHQRKVDDYFFPEFCFLLDDPS
jgi:hypothetical protein